MELLLSIHVIEVMCLFWQFWQLSKSILLCYATHIPERCSSASLLLLCTCCSSVLLLCHCSAAQVQLVWLCNHWERLHCFTLPVLLKHGLAWLGFFVSELAWLGFMEISGKKRKKRRKKEDVYQNYHPSIWRVLSKSDNSWRKEFHVVPQSQQT